MAIRPAAQVGRLGRLGRLGRRRKPTTLTGLRAQGGFLTGEIAENSTSGRPLRLLFSITVDFDDPDAPQRQATLHLANLDPNGHSWRDFGGRTIMFDDTMPPMMADGEPLPALDGRHGALRLADESWSVLVTRLDFGPARSDGVPCSLAFSATPPSGRGTESPVAEVVLRPGPVTLRGDVAGLSAPDEPTAAEWAARFLDPHDYERSPDSHLEYRPTAAGA